MKKLLFLTCLFFALYAGDAAYAWNSGPSSAAYDGAVAARNADAERGQAALDASRYTPAEAARINAELEATSRETLQYTAQFGDMVSGTISMDQPSVENPDYLGY